MADRDDFESIATPHLTTVYRAAFALAGRADQAEELTQTVFLKALERFASFRPGTNCRAWLLRILRNAWIDQLRHRRIVGPEVPLEEGLLADERGDEEPPASDLAGLLERFSDRQVIAALLELPDEQRLTLLLVDVEGLSVEETADVLDVAPGTVKSRASRARSALRKRLDAHARDLGFMGRQT